MQMADMVLCGGQTVMMLAVYAAILVGIPVLAWPWVKQMPVHMRQALTVVFFMAAALILFPDLALAFPTPERCHQYNYWQWPCWIIEALLCACTWPNDPPPPLPPG